MLHFYLTFDSLKKTIYCMLCQILMTSMSLDYTEHCCYDLHFPFGQPHYLGQLDRTTLTLMILMILMILMSLPFDHMCSTQKSLH